MTLFEIVPSLRRGATPRIDGAVWPRTTHVDGLGRLCVGGMALTEVGDQYGTPTYVIDEADFRYRVRRYRTALPEARLVYAGRALLTTAIARWVAEEGAGLGVCSRGELATALLSGLDPSRIMVDGRAITSNELCKMTNARVGRVVVDGPSQMALLAAGVRQPQAVQIRVPPDVDFDHNPLVAATLDQPLINLVGLQFSIGSQVSDPSLYGQVIRQMVPLMAEIRARHGMTMTELNIGGGQGVPYVSGDPDLDIDAFRDSIDDALDASCAAERFPRPVIVVEPGRAISARAGITLYRVLRVQSQPGGHAIAIVDGGLSDNPRVGVHEARYTVALANRHSMTATQPTTVVGRQGEPEGEIACDVLLPTDLHAGDLIAVACTGAYHHTMASTYTMVGRPPLVAVKNGRTRELVRRETIADLLSRDRAHIEPPPTPRERPGSGWEALIHGE